MEEHGRIIRIFRIYQGISLVISSVLFYFGNAEKEENLKYIILCGMILAFIIDILVYNDNAKIQRTQMILVVIEIIWNSIFFCISGGYLSPYVWYFVSYILIIGMELPFFCCAVSAALFGLAGILGAWKYHMVIQNGYPQILVGCGFILMAGSMLLLVYNRRDLEESKERNKLANEIHDTVLQKLFALSCNAYLIEQGCPNEEEKLKLHQLKQALDHTMKELRETIFGISWDEVSFVKRVNTYMSGLEQLYQIRIECVIEPGDDIFTNKQKSALYRVICEATNNAVRHGQSDYVSIKIKMELNSIFTIIQDNGTGFREEINREGKKRGLVNMDYLVHQCGGEIIRKSIENEGSQILVRIPYRGKR